jgi:hypothetical protein
MFPVLSIMLEGNVLPCPKKIARIVSSPVYPHDPEG